jgi:hypothetical protein
MFRPSQPESALLGPAPSWGVALTLTFALILGGCAWTSSTESLSVEDLAGQWEGSMVGRLGRGPATLVVQSNGRFEGLLHLTDGDRPFSGTIIPLGGRRARYAGTEGDGTVTLQHEDGPALKFVLDGGAGTATYLRQPASPR